MALINNIVSWVFKQRLHQMELFTKYPHEVQEDVLRRLLKTARDTEFGRKHGFADIRNADAFAGQVPVQDYEDFREPVARMMSGATHVLWPGEVKWYAKSSGTTGGKSKFIPVTEESMEECHFKGGKDMIALYCHNTENTNLFTGKSLTLSGSHSLVSPDADRHQGDLSAIILQNLPLLAEWARTPSIETALLSNWEEKLDKLVEEVRQDNVTSLAGVPSWILRILLRLLESARVSHVHEVWPNLEVFFHGGVNMAPYFDSFNRIMGPSGIRYMETYNASEGFFGLQDRLDHRELLLMLDYGIYYEFEPVFEPGVVLPLSAVELGKTYALIISTNGGLWRYRIGDTIRFTSLLPYRFTITGRTKSFINAFGEELVVENAERALEISCKKSGAVVAEYTAAPVFQNAQGKGHHQWLIEFSTPPENPIYFAELLDNALKALNSDYEAKRAGNLLLGPPEIVAATAHTFYRWMEKRNKLGGQHKVPRLCNNREVMEEILKYL
jgi:hypothetical protein